MNLLFLLFQYKLPFLAMCFGHFSFQFSWLENGCIRLDIKSHWTYLLQILSKLCFQKVVLSGNYAIVAISTDKNTFLMTLIIELTLGNIFIKVKKSARAAPLSQMIYFSNADNSTTLTPPGSPRVSREAKLSSKFEFGSLVR